MNLLLDKKKLKTVYFFTRVLLLQYRLKFHVFNHEDVKSQISSQLLEK